YRAAPLPDPRPEATREHLGALDTLGTPVATYDEAAAADWLDKVADPLPLYRGPRGWVHPAFFLHLANRALSLNVRLGPWIHAGAAYPARAHPTPRHRTRPDPHPPPHTPQAGAPAHPAPPPQPPQVGAPA